MRYRHTTSVGGNDAVLLDCQDPQGSTSPLFLVRFTITGSGPPQVADFTDALTVLEPDTKPGSYTAIDGDVSVTDSDSPVFTGGTMILTVLNGTTGEDQLDLIAGATVGAGGAVSVGATGIGTVSGRGTTELSFVFSAGAGPTTVGALIRAIGYRFTALAPRNNVGRALRLRITDGSSGGGVTEAVKTVIIDPWNDPPVVAGADIATIPGLARNGAITASDPEGLSQAGMTLGVIANPTRGTLVFTPATGAYTYTPGFLSAATTGDVVTDTFIIGATDVAFAGGDARRIASPSDAAGRTPARTGQRTITVRITNSGAGGLAFRNAPRMTVTSGGIFSYEPVVSAPAGAALIYELVSDPGVTAFSSTTGIINWNPVTTPPAGGYHRFGILVTDTVSGTSAFLPIMLRVGPGGTG